MMYLRKLGLLVTLCLLAALALVACGETATPATSGTTAAAAQPTSGAVVTGGAASGKTLKVGLVTDIGQLNDKSFNAAAWAGVQQAGKDLGATTKAIETKATSDYAKNISQFLDDKYDVIVTVGFLMQDATLAAAKANPTVKFIGVDQGYAETPANLAGLVFEEDKSGFLAGVLAAGISKSHKIAGILGTKSVPAVARFGEGYKAGAAYLDKTFPDMVGKQTTDAKLVYHADGDTAFSDPAWGAEQAKSLIQSGYDVIFGAGGKTGNGAIEGAADQGAFVIGVDDDQYVTLASEDPKIAGKILSSAQKLIQPGVFKIIQTVQAGTFKGGVNVGPVALAPFHDSDGMVPQALKDTLTKIKTGLDDGSIKTGVTIK